MAAGAAALVAGATLAGSAFLVKTTCFPLEGGGALLELLELLLESDSSLLESSEEEDSTFLAGFLATSFDFAIENTHLPPQLAALFNWSAVAPAARGGVGAAARRAHGAHVNPSRVHA